MFIISRTGISQPFTIRRESNIPNFCHRVLHSYDNLFCCYIQQVDTILTVCIDNCLRIRTPFERADIRIVVLCQLNRFAACCFLQIQFRLAGSIRNVSDLLSIGRPLGFTIMLSR